jgi:alpha-L-rhamnosidase
LTAFNNKFLDKNKAIYGNGSQTSQVLPLAYGMVPPEYKDRVFNYLVDKIMVEGKGHIGTGLIGGQWLNRVLSDNGRPDVAYTIAGQTDYPSWGYMISRGATTIWELWNGDTADPAMNSHNHVMLVGDLGIWMYEYLGGIRPDLEKAQAFRRIILKPVPVDGLESANVTYKSPMGPIASEWKAQGDTFNWTFSIPANTVATVFVPAKDAASVTEGGKPAAEAKGLKFVRMENGAAVYEAGSGQYSIASVK